ncbi:MAG: sulfurtransferase [Phycisphaerae bacterium]|nr:sulfurtransferase [Phycisphaerae bacterium]
MNQPRNRIIFRLALLAVSASIGCSGQDAEIRSRIVIEPEQITVDSAATDRRIVILDVRTLDAYDAGHLTRAVHVDPHEWKQASLAADEGIENADEWSRRIGDLGIDANTPVRIYDDGSMNDAARVWFILQLFGVTDATVLNGGWAAIAAAPDNQRPAVSRTHHRPKARHFTARPVLKSRPVQIQDRAEVRSAIEDRSVQILDARTPGEFRGEITHNNPRAGHLPGALNLPHANLMTPDGRLRSPDELAVIFEKAGFVRGRPIVTYCESGGRASIAAIAALHAGFGPVTNYYRSYSDWSRDAACPVIGD